MVKVFFENRSLTFATLASLLLMLLLWAMIAMNIPNKDSTVVLHYSIYLGVDEVGPWYRLFVFPLSGALILALNTVMAIRFVSSAKMFSLFLVYASLCMQMLLGFEGTLILLRNL